MTQVPFEGLLKVYGTFERFLTNNESIVPNQEIWIEWTKAQLPYLGYLGFVSLKIDQTPKRDLEFLYFLENGSHGEFDIFCCRLEQSRDSVILTGYSLWLTGLSN